MINIYASSVAKEVFEWITLIVLVIGLFWALIFNIMIPRVADGFILSPSTMVGGYILKFGGLALTLFSTVMLFIYQGFWKPYKHLKGVDDDKLNVFIDENKNK